MSRSIPRGERGAIFFLGPGLTFLLVRFLPGPEDRRWALYPAFFLILAGLALGSRFFGLSSYFWPAVLILVGLSLILRGAGIQSL